MHIKKIRALSTKRFNDLTIDELPPTARLVVMAGPNGSGKSSLFDVFRIWHGIHYGGSSWSQDRLYHLKSGDPKRSWTEMVGADFLDFHESIPAEQSGRQKLFYIRSAYRNDPDFSVDSLQRVGSVFDAPKPQKMIDSDMSVGFNYRMLVSDSIESLFSGDFDESTGRQIREQLIGQVQASMGRVFDDLVLTSLGNPLQNGSFFFDKGASRNFHYKNLSGGEKAAFDLILDLILKRRTYDDTVYCIDEPEAHVSTRLQARLLAELVQLVPDQCQLWIATHSIGMMKQAMDLQSVNPEQVVFLDFGGKDFDAPVQLTPVEVDRDFWASTLSVALGDLAALVAPGKVVLCEGQPATVGGTKAELDAACYRTIFRKDYPDVDFLSVGNADAVQRDRLGVGQAIQTLNRGTIVVRLVDRDDRSVQEIDDLQRNGVRVLSRRHLEAYLLDDEVLTKLCEVSAAPEKVSDVLAAKQDELGESRKRGNPADDVKSAAGPICVATRQILGLTQAGSTTDALLRDTLAPLVAPEMSVYSELKLDIFNE